VNDDVTSSNINSVEFNSECKALDSDVESTQVIGRQVFRFDGVYVKGQVHAFDINFTVDTGAARTVLSTKTFRRIPQFKR
jgi:predicted aspartyl protease